jgi:hypothetical protein
MRDRPLKRELLAARAGVMHFANLDPQMSGDEKLRSCAQLRPSTPKLQDKSAWPETSNE